jgi:hypothetical protein
MNGSIYISPVTVTLTATDDDSGVLYTEYRYDSWTYYTEPFVISEDGFYNLHFCSMDKANNLEDEKICNFTIWIHPSKPIISGTQLGTTGKIYNYTFTSIDYNGGHNIYYYIDWGDNTNTSWIGPYPSGEKVNISHSWMNEIRYAIKAKVKDIYDGESNWSSYLLIICNPPLVPAFLLGGFIQILEGPDLIWMSFFGLYIGLEPLSFKFIWIQDTTFFIDKITKKGLILPLINSSGTWVGGIIGKFSVTEFPIKNFDSLFASHDSSHRPFYLQQRFPEHTFPILRHLLGY